jgi:hypothetical protein
MGYDKLLFCEQIVIQFGTESVWNPQGSRRRGRPNNSWRRSVIKEAEKKWNELRFLAADRSGKNS